MKVLREKNSTDLLEIVEEFITGNPEKMMLTLKGVYKTIRMPLRVVKREITQGNLIIVR